MAEADAVLRANGVANRCEVRSGDFFTSVPKGGDLHLIKSVIHDWNDGKASAILRNCREAMGADGRLPGTVESPPEPMSALKYLSDLNMLVNLDGRERTSDDFTRLLRRSGFEPGEFLAPPGLGVFRLIQASPSL